MLKQTINKLNPNADQIFFFINAKSAPNPNFL